jgi:hypothetical protein
MSEYLDEDLPEGVTQQQLRAQARSERHRVRTELHRLRGSSESSADDLDEPGPAYKSPRHNTLANTWPERPKPEVRHWKLPFWKRRSANRRKRASSSEPLDEQ